MKRTDEIVIYATPEEIKKKQSKRFSLHFWQFTSPPLTWPKIKRIYFAAKGKVQGSFKVTGHGIGRGGKKRLYFNPRSWRKTKYNIETESFRGFRYRWW